MAVKPLAYWCGLCFMLWNVSISTCQARQPPLRKRPGTVAKRMAPAPPRQLKSKGEKQPDANIFQRRENTNGKGGRKSHSKSSMGEKANNSETPNLADMDDDEEAMLLAQLESFGIFLNGPPVVLDFYENSSVDLRLFDFLLGTPVTSIDMFLVPPDQQEAIEPLQGLMLLFQSRMAATNTSSIPLPSDKDFLTTIMLQVDTTDDDTNRQLQLVDERDILCVKARLEFFAEFFGLILSLIGLASGGNVARRLSAKILDVLLRAGDNKIARLASVPLAISNTLDDWTRLLVRIIRTVTLKQFYSLLVESMSFVDWLVFGVRISLDIAILIAAGVPSGGAGSGAYLTLRFVAAGINLAATGKAYLDAIDVCDRTEAPTLSPVTPILPPAVTSNENGWTSGVFGDPHLATFDGMRFDCQATGEFVMVKSLENPDGLVIQERFSRAADSTICSQASVSTGIAIAEESFPTIQFSIPASHRTDANSVVETSGMLNSCPVDLFVDGVRRPLEDVAVASPAIGGRNPIPDVDVTTDSSTIVFGYRLTRMRVTVDVANRMNSFGCFLRVQVFIPYDYLLPGQTLVGLLGKPNRNAADDWVDRTGNSLSGPASEAESVFGVAYDYCVSNWCIEDEGESIFTYREDDGESFASMFGCDSAYASQELEAQVANADADLSLLCDGNIVCLVDGICGNLDDAVAALQDEEDIVQAQQDTSGQLFSQSLLLPPSSGTDDDGFVTAFDTITLESTQQLFGQRISAVVVSQDGFITLHPDPTAFNEGPALIAAFWVEGPSPRDLFVRDLNVRLSGASARFLERTDLSLVEAIVRQGLSPSFAATDGLVVTWYVYDQRTSSDDADDLEFFQLVLVQDAVQRETFVVLSYDGLDDFGSFAVVGRNDGRSRRGEPWITVESDADLAALLSGTNCGRAGTYAFNVS